MGKKRFDPTLKQLVESYPGDWLRYFAGLLGVPRVGGAEVVDADVSTVTRAVDKVIRVGGRRPWIFHLELVSSHQHRLDRKLLLYNVLIGDRHDLPVRTVVLLLRREADRASLDEDLRLEWPEGERYLQFRYKIVRLWEQPAESLLSAGLGLLPLAPVADVTRQQLPDVIRRMDERFRTGATPDEANDLWSATYFLMGLHYPATFAKRLLQGVREMKESTTYQAVLAEGALRILLRIGARKLGEPDQATRATLDAISDVDRLEQMAERVEEARDWAELLKTPTARRGGRAKRK